MTTADDPYTPPAASLERGPGSLSASESVSPTIVTLLAQTRPWVRLVAVAIFTLSALGALAMPVMMLSTLGGTSSGVVALTGLLMLVVVLGIYLPPGILLWRYGSRIGDVVAGGGQPALERAIRSQKTFWKYVGIALVVLLAFYAVAFIGGLLLAPLMKP